MTRWRADFLPGYSTTDLPLDDPPAPGEPDDTELVATLVRKNRRRPRTAAVLYLHGWNDYFFQTHLAEGLDALGLDFYAIDLRRYGRSLRPGQHAGFVSDLDDYGAELTAATDLIAAHHRRLILMGHSTGGLIAALYAAKHPERLTALVLNSPWLDLQGSAAVRMLGGPVIDALGSSRPTSVLRLPPDTGFYARTLHSTLEGEWDYDLKLKASPGPPIRVGWLRAILQGHQRVAGGLGLAVPILVMCSTRTDFSRRFHEGLRLADVVLDVEQIVSRATRLGRHVTIVRFEGAMHDVLLSGPAVREQVLAEMSRWLTAYAA